MRAAWVWLLFCGGVVHADSVVATSTIPARTVLSSEHVKLIETSFVGAFQNVDAVVGLETRVAIYAGRPVTPTQLGPPTVVERNQIISLIFQASGLIISTEGRALQSGSAGDTIRVMNLASRSTVFAQLTTEGSAYVSGNN